MTPWWCCLGWKSYLCVADRLSRCKMKAICDAHDRAVMDPKRWGEPVKATPDDLDLTGEDIGRMLDEGQPVAVVHPDRGLWGCQHMTASVHITSTPCCGPARPLPVNGVASHD